MTKPCKLIKSDCKTFVKILTHLERCFYWRFIFAFVFNASKNEETKACQLWDDAELITFTATYSPLARSPFQGIDPESTWISMSGQVFEWCSLISLAGLGWKVSRCFYSLIKVLSKTIFVFTKPWSESEAVTIMEPCPSLSFSIPHFSISEFRIHDNYDSISNTAGASVN